MLRFELDLEATDTTARTISGTLVPYGAVAQLAGVAYTFRPGSLRAHRTRTPLLLGHDRNRPVGILAELTETDESARAVWRVDDTPDGDIALAQAASGSRGGLSVGATVERSEMRADGIVEVIEAALHETSLVTVEAFEGAHVDGVAAGWSPPDVRADIDESGGLADEPDEENETDDDETDDDDDDDEKTDNEQLEVETMETESVEAAASRAPAMLISERPRPKLTAGAYVHAMLSAQRGDRDAAALIEAALTETISTDVPGLLPPSYESGVIGPAPIDRVLYDVFGGRALPGVGLTVQKPTWTTFPNGAWAATVDDDATTGKAVIGLNAATIERWDWATAIPYTVVQRSSPDAVDTIYAGAVENFYLDVETKIAALLDTTAGTPNAAIKLGAGIGAFYTRCGRAPDVIIVAPDVWGLLADAGALSVPHAAGGVAAGESGLRSTFGGVPAVASASLAAGTKYMATRRALDVRITTPVQLTANAIGALNVELGVVGEGLFDADVALEVMELAAGAPVLLDASGRAAKS